MCSVGILQRYICLHDKWTNNMIVNDKYLYILLSLQPSSVYYMVIHLIYLRKSQENMFDLQRKIADISYSQSETFSSVCKCFTTYNNI